MAVDRKDFLSLSVTPGHDDSRMESALVMEVSIMFKSLDSTLLSVTTFSEFVPRTDLCPLIADHCIKISPIEWIYCCSAYVEWPKPFLAHVDWMLIDQSTLLFRCVPKNSEDSTMWTSSQRMQTGVKGFLFLFKSLLFFPHCTFKGSAHTSPQRHQWLLCTILPLTHPTIKVSSEYFCRWHDPALYLMSVVWSVNRKGARTFP